MTDITAEPFVYTGFQTGVVYELNANGRPNGTTLDPYTGIEVYAAKLYNLTLPSSRKVPHVGNDRLLKVQQFPSQEVATGEISVGAEDLQLIAALTGLTVLEVAGMQMLPHMTDIQGKEPNVGLLLYQAALAQSGPQRYHFHMVTSTKAIPRLPGFGADPIDIIYDIAPDPVDRYLWGYDMAPLGDVSDPYSGVSPTGAMEAGVWSGFAAGEPRICAWVADGVEDTFLFPENMPANDATNIAVWTATGSTVTPVPLGSGVTAALTGVVFDSAPTVDHEVIVLYQK